MHCRTCGYALWNLTEPRCPECGNGFDLRSYRFRPGTVGFACPHCGHLHGGRGERYLPSGGERATCLGCGAEMCVPNMRVVPLTADAFANPADIVPWEDRRRQGFWRAWWRTMLLSMIFPQRLGRMLRGTTNWRAAYGFATFVCVGAFTLFALSFLAILAIFALIGAVSSGRSGTAIPWGALMGFLICGGIPVLYGLLVPALATVVHAGGAHLLLKMTGARAGGFRLTARCLLYAQGADILAALPLFGFYLWIFGYLWVSIAAVFTLMEGQRVSPLRAMAASLWLPVVVVVLFMGFIAYDFLFASTLSLHFVPATQPAPVVVPLQPRP